MRQDHDAEDDQPAHRADVGNDRGATARTSAVVARPTSCAAASATSSSRSGCSRTGRCAATSGSFPSCSGGTRSAIDARCDELADLVGLDRDLLDRYPAALSGGQQQRVGVARALAADPPILLMDEPYSAVDPIVRERLQDELLTLQATVRKTIVLVTHDIDEAIKLADRVAILNVGGVLEQYATPDELLASAGERVRRFVPRPRARPAPAGAAHGRRHRADHGADRDARHRSGRGARGDGTVRHTDWVGRRRGRAPARLGRHATRSASVLRRPSATSRSSSSCHRSARRRRCARRST